MDRFWTCHWQFATWHPDVNLEGQPVRSSGSNTFHKRGVSVGDTIYVVSLSGGQLYLGGRMTVKQLVTRPQAVRLLKTTNLYDADEWVVDPELTGTRLDLHRRLSPSLTKRLRFASKSGPKEPCFISETELDKQATRGVRELMAESASLLDQIISITDRFPKTGNVVTVTEGMLTGGVVDEFQLPDELPTGSVYSEGSYSRIEVNRYERDRQARLACIAAHGNRCVICGFSFGAFYGPDAEGYIHVHHVRPLSEVGGNYIVDPIEDLQPVCPNCHAILHLGGRCRTVEEVRHLVDQQKHSEPDAATLRGA